MTGMLITAQGIAVQDVIDRLTYKPGWTFTVREGIAHGRMGPLLRVTYPAPDRDHPDQIREQTFTTNLPPWGMTAEEWQAWIFRNVVLRIEEHEAAEFFLVGGERVFDPHDPAHATLSP